VNSPTDIISFDHHVHYYPLFSWSQLLEKAVENLSDSACKRFKAVNTHAAICLLETEGTQWFQALPETLQAVPNWDVHHRLDDRAMTLKHKDGRLLSVIKGRQLVTVENLEVLIIGDDSEWAERPRLDECLERASEQVIVLPWAVGKWMGARGKIVTAALDGKSHLFNIGDNGGRPKIWSRVSQFDLASKLGKNILPGSDPLPLVGAELRAGSSGVLVAGHLHDSESLDCFLSALRSNSFEGSFSLQQNTVSFLREQLMLRAG